MTCSHFLLFCCRSRAFHRGQCPPATSERNSRGRNGAPALPGNGLQCFDCSEVAPFGGIGLTPRGGIGTVLPRKIKLRWESRTWNCSTTDCF